MFDLILNHAALPEGTFGIDISCKEGIVAAVAKGILAEAREIIDACGYLMSPPICGSAYLH